ncbi:hypothetical protein Sjap_001166 [Stephania japonica]|uniref:Uncharacterized protein n=1 Tax=Stephania japonica TaxID=461633 RepID=A0AAP0PUS5_9MAGN
MEGAQVPDQKKMRQQGVYESLHRDIMVGFGDGGFDPLVMSNPFLMVRTLFIYGKGVRIGLFLFSCNVMLQKGSLGSNIPRFLMLDNVYIDAILRELLLGERPLFA